MLQIFYYFFVTPMLRMWKMIIIHNPTFGFLRIPSKTFIDWLLFWTIVISWKRTNVYMKSVRDFMRYELACKVMNPIRFCLKFCWIHFLLCFWSICWVRWHSSLFNLIYLLLKQVHTLERFPLFMCAYVWYSS